MNTPHRLTLALASAAVCMSTYANVPNNNYPTPLIGPTLRMSNTSFITDITAYSIAGELGFGDIRASGTLAWAFRDNQRLKFTAEYLSQDLTYTFYSGNATQWVYQVAVGGDYVYAFNFTNQTELELNAYYSYAPGNGLATVNGLLFRKGLLIPYQNIRHIAGSNAGGGSAGLSIEPWIGARGGLALDYDYVVYRTNYSAPDDDKGLGGTAWLDTLLTDTIGIYGAAGIRKPFNYYAVDFYVQNLQYMGRWRVGLFGEYVDGKKTLPNSWNLGLNADYYFDPCVSLPMNLKGEANYKGEPATTSVRQPNSFLNWTGDPAVRMPTVLAIPDQKVTFCVGDAPKLISAIPDITTPIHGPTVIATAAHFKGKNLVFTSTFSSIALSDSVTINATTGVVTVTPGVFDFQHITVNVTASNSCGSVTSTFTVPVEGTG